MDGSVMRRLGVTKREFGYSQQFAAAHFSQGCSKRDDGGHSCGHSGWWLVAVWEQGGNAGQATTQQIAQLQN